MIVIVVATFILAALTLSGGILAQASMQQRRIGVRLDTLATSVAAAPDPAAAQRAALLDALKGERAPGFSLPTLDGERVTLDALLAPGTPLMLVFAEPRCGPCYEILPDLGGWQRVYGDRLSIALVSSGEPETNAAMTSPSGIAPVLLQHEAEVVMAYGLIQAPAAVLIQPDGRISAGPRYGSRAIRQLVADTLGLALPQAPSIDITSVGVGEPVPSLRRPDLRGNLIDLTAPRGVPTLMLFWSPGCSHCQELLPAILAADQLPNPPGMVIVSQGPIGLTEEIGFRAPAVFDDDRSLARTFGVEGTPSAVVLDGQGRVATHVFRGEHRVRALLERITSLVAPTPDRTPSVETHPEPQSLSRAAAGS
jgi:thiol-disulfide isomerase/thioredoxin